jgi:hypothetical protein
VGQFGVSVYSVVSNATDLAMVTSLWMERMAHIFSLNPLHYLGAKGGSAQITRIEADQIFSASLFAASFEESDPLFYRLCESVFQISIVG